MRILVILRSAWRNDNNTGNTMTNFFSDIDAEIYSVSLRDQLPQNDIAIKNYTISESQLVRNIVKGTPTGKILEKKDYDSPNNNRSDTDIESKVYDIAKRLRRYIFFYIREIIWKNGKWKTEELDKYIEEVSPDVIFMAAFNCMYPYKILQYIHSKTNAKVILYHADDNYTLRQFSLNPIFWIYRLHLRKFIREAVDISSVNYAISTVQKNECEQIFHKEFKFLTKFDDFNEEPKLKESYSLPLQFVYTGNLDLNRWKSIKEIVKALQKINVNGTRAQLRIYSGTALTKRMKKAIEIPETSFFMGKVSASKVSEIQLNADVLIHAESMDLKNRLIVHQSFSTKLVDYMKKARTIFAFGPADNASICHLKENDAAVVATSKNEILKSIEQLVEDPSLLNVYAKKSYECGRKFHNKDTLQKMITDDMKK